MMKIKVLYEDNHLLVVEKPVNMPVQKDISGDDDLLTVLKTYIKGKYNKPGDVYLGLVHRLDRPVGGVMVFARTSKAASRLSEQIRKREVKKTYLAVAQGQLSSLCGTLNDYLYKDRDSNTVQVVSKDTAESREAILQYQVMECRENKTLLKVDLETGRSHQIRVQLSNFGHPLTGDIKYGQKGQKGFTNSLALWSYTFTLSHPVRKEIMNFTCVPPNSYPWNLFEIYAEEQKT